MSIRGIVTSLAILALLLSATSSSAQSLIREDFSNVINWLHDGNTKVKRKTYWNEAKGKRTTVTGKVTDVKDAGWVMPVRVEIEPTGGRGRVSVTCMIGKKNTRSQSLAYQLNVGSPVTCSGRLSTYSLVMNMLSVSVEEAGIEVPK